MQLDIDSTKWQQVYFYQILQETNKLVVPLLLNSQVIALMMTSTGWTDVAKWKLGAYIQREIFTGLTLEKQDARLDSAKKLYVNRLQVFTYNVACEYSLVISPLLWGSGETLAVWEYTGGIT